MNMQMHIVMSSDFASPQDGVGQDVGGARCHLPYRGYDIQVVGVGLGLGCFL